MKKRILTLVSILFLVLNQGYLFAQDDSQTLFGEKGLVDTSNLGYFFSPVYGFTEMDGSRSTVFNLRGGISFSEKFAAGAYFNIAHNESRPQSEPDPTVYLEYWTVGGFTEYTLVSKKVVHVTFPLYLGYGEVEMYSESGQSGLGSSGFFQIEPSTLLEVNLNRFIRFNMGAGYRLISHMNYRNISQSDISGLTGYFGLKFGSFR
ncbi:hypothetical protein [Algoriphagus namhaensis]